MSESEVLYVPRNDKQAKKLAQASRTGDLITLNGKKVGVVGMEASVGQPIRYRVRYVQA